MPVSDLLERLFHRTADRVFAWFPRHCPDRSILGQVKLVSHRGERDNRRVLENTIEAFDAVLHRGVWGVEFDIRWTRDLHPVVFHDPDLRRLFGSAVEIRERTLHQLRADFPSIPTLEEVIRRYGRKMHLMAEIKEEDWPEPAYQNQVLGDLFSALAPAEDFHLLSLEPSLFERIHFAPPSSFLPVAELNVAEMSALALQNRYAGLAGHYLLLTRPILEKHKAAGQKIATGHIASKNCLCREINRGVDWIFTNTALRIQAICEELCRGP